MNYRAEDNYTGLQLTLLVILRVLIGWHFLFEGLSKVFNHDWSSVGFLLDSKGLFSGFFVSLASDPGVLRVVDFLNMWGLVAVGLGLITGCLGRVAKAGGIILLTFYFLSHPPMVGFRFSAPSEGSYLWVNKNLIELFTLAVLMVFPTSHIFGIDRFLFKIRGR
ncbi:MAG: DoxX family membrane protein [Bacteroidia bacterium]|nr:MAG: DoxX family membrane protein [Bacteroidia bacterium]